MTSIRRREFLGMVAAAGMLAACGDDADESGSGSGSGTASGTATTAAGSSQTRTVTTDDGSLEVPADPQRVVAAIGSFETDMVAVGVMPILTTSFAGPWVELDDDVVITENIPPTAEELLELRPDLMVGWNWVTKEPSFDAISQIAPYVGLGESAATTGPGFDYSEPMRSWDTLFLSVCDAVGRRDQGAELVEGLESRLDELAAQRAGEPALSVARIEFYTAGSFSYRGQEEDSAELLRRVGLEVVGPDQTIQEESLERLPEIDADWLVIPVGNDSVPRELYDEVAETELFKSIPAVEAGRVHLVDGDLWPGLGYLWAMAMVDDIERLFFAS
jgi:iron complex transport system substrate-binding protein